jgi:hypothetical protein
MIIFSDSMDYFMPKKIPPSWRQKSGNLIAVEDMSDIHLANAIRMMVRMWSTIRPGEAPNHSKYQVLAYEAKRRGFIITIHTTPFILNGKSEFAEIHIPTGLSKIVAGFFPSELDSREYA